MRVLLLVLEHVWVLVCYAEANLIHLLDERKYPDPFVQFLFRPRVQGETTLRELQFECELPARGRLTRLFDLVLFLDLFDGQDLARLAALSRIWLFDDLNCEQVLQVERSHLVPALVLLDIQFSRGVDDPEVPQVPLCATKDALAVNFLAQVALDVPEAHGESVRLKVGDFDHDLFNRGFALVHGPPDLRQICALMGRFLPLVIDQGVLIGLGTQQVRRLHFRSRGFISEINHRTLRGFDRLTCVVARKAVLAGQQAKLVLAKLLKGEYINFT